MPRRKTTKRKQFRGPGGGFARKAPEVAPAEDDVVDEADAAFSGQESPIPVMLNDDGAAAMDEAEEGSGEGCGEGAAGGVQDECQTILPLGSAAGAAEGGSMLSGAATTHLGSSSVGIEIAPRLVPPRTPQSTHGGGDSASEAAAAAAAAGGAGAAGVGSAASSGEGAGVPDTGSTAAAAAAATRTSTREGKFSGPFYAPKRGYSGAPGRRGGPGRGAKLLMPDEVLFPFAEFKARKGGKAGRKLRKANLKLKGEVWTREKRIAAIRASSQQEGGAAGSSNGDLDLQQGAAAATA